MATFPNSAPAPAVSIVDLEYPIHDARQAAHILEIVIDKLLEQRHPLPAAQLASCTALLLDDDEVEALQYAAAKARYAADEVHRQWFAAFKANAQKRQEGIYTPLP